MVTPFQNKPTLWANLMRKLNDGKGDPNIEETPTLLSTWIVQTNLINEVEFRIHDLQFTSERKRESSIPSDPAKLFQNIGFLDLFF